MPMHLEHIVPIAAGGTSDEDNLWLACPLKLQPILVPDGLLLYLIIPLTTFDIFLFLLCHYPY